jgi:hypothetical protein
LLATYCPPQDGGGAISCCETLAYFKYTPVKAKIEIITNAHFSRFRGAINLNNFYFLVTSLHVLASTVHPQVKYTQLFLKAISPVVM